MANQRASETGKQRHQQVISIIGLLLSVNIFVSFFLSNFELLTSSFTYHPRVTKVCAALHAHLRSYVRLLSKLTPSNIAIFLYLLTIPKWPIHTSPSPVFHWCLLLPRQQHLYPLLTIVYKRIFNVQVTASQAAMPSSENKKTTVTWSSWAGPNGINFNSDAIHLFTNLICTLAHGNQSTQEL